MAENFTHNGINVDSRQFAVDQFTPEQKTYLQRIIDNPNPESVANEGNKYGLRADRVTGFATLVARNRQTYV